MSKWFEIKQYLHEYKDFVDDGFIDTWPGVDEITYTKARKLVSQRLTNASTFHLTYTKEGQINTNLLAYPTLENIANFEMEMIGWMVAETYIGSTIKTDSGGGVEGGTSETKAWDPNGIIEQLPAQAKAYLNASGIKNVWKEGNIVFEPLTPEEFARYKQLYPGIDLPVTKTGSDLIANNSEVIAADVTGALTANKNAIGVNSNNIASNLTKINNNTTGITTLAGIVAGIATAEVITGRDDDIIFPLATVIVPFPNANQTGNVLLFFTDPPNNENLGGPGEGKTNFTAIGTLTRTQPGNQTHVITLSIIRLSDSFVVTSATFEVDFTTSETTEVLAWMLNFVKEKDVSYNLQMTHSGAEPLTGDFAYTWALEGSGGGGVLSSKVFNDKDTEPLIGINPDLREIITKEDSRWFQFPGLWDLGDRVYLNNIKWTDEVPAPTSKEELNNIQWKYISMSADGGTNASNERFQSEEAILSSIVSSSTNLIKWGNIIIARSISDGDIRKERIYSADLIVNWLNDINDSYIAIDEIKKQEVDYDGNILFQQLNQLDFSGVDGIYGWKLRPYKITELLTKKIKKVGK